MSHLRGRIPCIRLSLIVLYVPEPTLDRAAKFYAAILNANPWLRSTARGPEHWSVTSAATGLVVELYPMGQRPHTVTRLEFRGRDVDDAVRRLTDRAYALPERTRDRAGSWCHDMCGNTVVLLPE